MEALSDLLFLLEQDLIEECKAGSEINEIANLSDAWEDEEWQESW